MKHYILVVSLFFLINPLVPILADNSNLTYTKLNNKTTNLQASEGKIVVVDLFATWCNPCEYVIDSLKIVYNKTNLDLVEIISISVDPSTDSLAKISKFKEDHEANWTFGLDEDYIFTEEFNVQYLPTLLIFNQTGQKVYTRTGTSSHNTIIREINKYLPENDTIENPENSTENAYVGLYDNLLNNSLFKGFGLFVFGTMVLLGVNLFRKMS